MYEYYVISAFILECSVKIQIVQYEFVVCNVINIIDEYVYYDVPTYY